MPDHENAGSTAGPFHVASAPPQPRRGSDYAELSRQVKQAGLLERRRWNYTWRIAVTRPDQFLGVLAAFGIKRPSRNSCELRAGRATGIPFAGLSTPRRLPLPSSPQR